MEAEDVIRGLDLFAGDLESGSGEVDDGDLLGLRDRSQDDGFAVGVGVGREVHRGNSDWDVAWWRLRVKRRR